MWSKSVIDKVWLPKFKTRRPMWCSLSQERGKNKKIEEEEKGTPTNCIKAQKDVEKRMVGELGDRILSTDVRAILRRNPFSLLLTCCFRFVDVNVPSFTESFGRNARLPTSVRLFFIHSRFWVNNMCVGSWNCGCISSIAVACFPTFFAFCMWH